MGRTKDVYVIGFEVPLEFGSTLLKMSGAASNQEAHEDQLNTRRLLSQDEIIMDLFHDRIFPIQRPVLLQPV